jgi:nucleoid-associated protein YgaU
MVELVGKSGNLALFANGRQAVVVDFTLNMVMDFNYLEVFSASRSWESATADVPQQAYELAAGALTSLDQGLTAAGQRLYTIPGGVQAEAKKALNWRKEEGRGGTPVGLNTARTLAKGGQIGIKKIRHIAKYFPRHEVDKQGKGWEPGEDNFPSNGRIAWALWGGDAAWRWARAIVERENKKATTAGGYAYSGYEDDIEMFDSDEQMHSDFNDFKMVHELDPYMGPEFMARVRLDNSGIDRLYKVEVDGQVYLWDGSGWDNMGHVDGDVYKYDKDLDSPSDTVEKTHVLIDPSSAVVISAFLQERPFEPVTLEEIDPDEAQLMRDGLYEEDFGTIDMIMTAAGEAPAPASAPKEKEGLTDGDGQFTPEERSELAKKQPRDASGLFVKVGSRTVVAGDTARGSGTLESIDYKNGKVNVRLDNGTMISVDPKYTDKEENSKALAPVAPRSGKPVAPVNTDRILGKAKRGEAPKKATLPENSTVLGPDGVGKMLLDWTKGVGEKRTTTTSAPSVKSRDGGKDEAKGESKTNSDGSYTVEKGDSLWAIAEKTKADGQSTEDQWLKIMAANKGKLKSGDPNLIFAGEKVAIPGKSGSSKSSSPSAQEAMRKDKQDTARADDAAKNKAAADQERIRSAKQEESRDAKNVQEAMRKDKQEVSKAEAAKNKAAADQEKLRNARNADRLDTTTKNKAKAEADARAGMQADKKAISDAEAAKKKAAADQEKLRNARNQDRVDTTAKAKAKAAADARAGMQADKKAISDAEAAKNKASADQEKLRNARNADRTDTTSKNKAKAEADARAGMQADKKAISTSEAKAAADAKAKAGVQADKKASSAAETARARQAAEDKAKSGAQGDKKASSVAEAKAATDAKARSGVQQAKGSESPGITKSEAEKQQARTQGDIAQGKKSDQPVIKDKQISNARKKLEDRKNYLRGQRQKYGTYEERVRAAKERNNPINKLSRGGN